MTLKAFDVQNYRCFQQGQRIELRPLTILLGRNNAGKSVIARWPLVAATGFNHGSSTPLSLDDIGAEDLRVSFRDLIYGQRPHGSINFTFHYTYEDFQDFSIETTIQNIDESQSQVVSDFTFRRTGVEGPLFSLRWAFEEDEGLSVGSRGYVANSSHGSTMVHVQFEGLLPTDISRAVLFGEDLEFFQEATKRAAADIGEVRYVGPFRERPNRHYRIPTRAPASVGTVGADAPGVLADDRLRRRGQVLDNVNGLLGDILRGWKLDVQQLGELYSMVLSPPGQAYQVNLADTGTGVAQVLPMLVQRAMDLTSPPRRPILEIIEQPELHLHPSAHADLADVYLAAAATRSTRFVIETHSETLILRLRRRIAEGLDPETVALYFIDHDGASSSARRIGIDQFGNVDYWPEGIFAEDYDETLKLAQAQVKAVEGHVG